MNREVPPVRADAACGLFATRFVTVPGTGKEPFATGHVRSGPAGRAATLRAVTPVLFTCAGQRVDIVTAFGRAGATTIAADVNPLAPALYHADAYALVPRVDDPGYVDAIRDLVLAHDVRLIVPLTDLDHEQLVEARETLGSDRAAARPRRRAHDRGQVPRAHVLRVAGDPVAAELAARGGSRRRRVPGARQGAARLRLAQHLPRARPRGARVLRPARTTPLASCRRAARARSSRSTSSATSRAAA